MEYGSWAEDPNPTNQTFLFTLQILSDIFLCQGESGKQDTADMVLGLTGFKQPSDYPNSI